MRNLSEIFLTFIICFLAYGTCYANEATEEDSLLQEKFKKINLLIDVQQYAQVLEGLEELKLTINPDISKENFFKYKLIEIGFYKKMGEPKTALKIIESLPEFEDFPELKLKLDFNHAAILVDFGSEDFANKKVVVMEIIERSKATAILLGNFNMLGSFVQLEAVLLNDECSYLKLNCKPNREKCRELFKQSMQLFIENGDTNNYLNAMNGYVRLVYYEPETNQDSLKNEMLKWLEGSVNVPNRINFYNQLADYASGESDSLKYYKYRLGASQAYCEMILNNSDNHLKNIQALYDFNELEAEVQGGKKTVAMQAEEIKMKNSRIRSIVLIIILCVILVVGITFFSIRQKQLNYKLNTSNKELNSTLEKYQLLIKESNHRIKNNLQMILSILEFSKAGLGKDAQDSMSKLASKISVVTELHKLLNFQEHNETVEMKSFFAQIIDSYTEINNISLEINANIGALELPSERMIYFGLIFNELLANTIEHRKGSTPVQVVVEKQKDTNLWCFSYQDNSSFGDFTRNNGLNLVDGLVSRLDGVEYEKDTSIGFYKFCFKA